MQVTEHIHALRIPFRIPVGPGKLIAREVYAYLVFGSSITLVDSGVSGAETIIFDYLQKNGREPKEISLLILSHSHPDHIGAAKALQEATGCLIAAHPGEKIWIEDTERQFQERPVPGFHALVGGPVALDRLLADGEILALGDDISCQIMHTPGHSKGSISLLFAGDKAIISGDALPLPHDLPIYEDLAACVGSIRKIQEVKNVENLLSSWEAPIQGRDLLEKRIDDGLSYLRLVHEAVLKAKTQGREEILDLCRAVVTELGLPPFAANPLVAGSLMSNLEVMAGAGSPFQD